MIYIFHARGHPKVTSLHKTTFEVTRDSEIGIVADCIIGTQSESVLEDIPEQIREAIRKEATQIKVVLDTKNAQDIITGYGHPDLSLDHPTDMVCRKSSFTCSRTLMIRADKAAVDLRKELVEDLKAGKDLKVTVILE